MPLASTDMASLAADRQFISPKLSSVLSWQPSTNLASFMALAFDTTALHIAGLFYAFALAPSVVTPLALALVAAPTSYTSYRFLLRDSSSNAQRRENSESISRSVCKTASFLAAQPYRAPAGVYVPTL